MNKTLNKHLLAALCATPLLLAGNFALAEEAAPAAPAAAEPASDFTFTINAGIYSAYMFRGIETARGPALQVGADLGHSSGFYAGTWWSNINPYFFGKTGVNVNTGKVSSGEHLETDWYVGFAKSFESGFGFNLLANYYYYPENEKNPGTNDAYDTLEVSAALSYKWLTYTFFYTPTDYYGTRTSTGGDTKGAIYNELKAVYPLPFGGLNLKAKIGYTDTGDVGAGCGGKICDAGIGDFAIGVNRDFTLPGSGKPISGFNAGLEYTDTFAAENEAFYEDFSPQPKKLNDAKLWGYIKRTW